MVRSVILELALALTVSFAVCALKNNKRRKIKVSNNLLIIAEGKRVEYVAALELTKVDPLSFVEPKRLREYSKALAKCCKGLKLEIRTVRGPEDAKSLLRKIENEIATLRIILQADPSNVKVEERLKYLEKLLNIMTKYPPISVKVYYIISGSSKSKVEKEIGVLEGLLDGILGAEVKRVKGSEIAQILRYGTKGKMNLNASTNLLASPPRPKSAKEAMIYIGMREDNEPALLGLDDLRHHVLVFGSTGSGKTTFLCSLIKRVRAIGLEDIIIFDPKGDLIRLCGNVSTKKYGPFNETEVGKRRQIATAFATEVLGKILENNLKDELETLVVVDEAWLLDREVLESIMREGRSRGVGVIAASHLPLDLGEVVFHNAHTKLFMKLDKVDTILERIGVVEEVNSLDIGEAIMLTRDGDTVKVKLEPEDHATTLTTLKSSRPNSDSTSSTSLTSPSSSTKKKFGTTLEL